MWAFGKDHSIITKLIFICWATILLFDTVESQRSIFVAAQWMSLTIKLLSAFALRANLRLTWGNLYTFLLSFGRPMPHKNYLPEIVPRPIGPDTRLIKILTLPKWYLTGDFTPLEEGLLFLHLSCTVQS